MPLASRSSVGLHIYPPCSARVRSRVMRAIVIREPGGPEVLEAREVPTPEPTRGEVRVRVRATAVNRADLLQRVGLYPAPPGVPTDIPGLEFAGEVAAGGDAVSEWERGDRVFGLVGGGAYAEFIVTHARTLARMPRDVSFTDAAAIPEAFVTAWDAMVEHAGLRAGETVLVHAAASGVGAAAFQIARAGALHRNDAFAIESRRCAPVGAKRGHRRATRAVRGRSPVAHAAAGG